MRTLGNRLHDILDVVNRIRYTCILRYALICKINLAVSIYRYILQQSVTFDSLVDIGLGFFIQIDNFSIATAFVVEYAFVVPSVLVVTDQLTFRVGRQSRLTGTGQTEEDSRAGAVHAGVGRAVHRSDTAQRIEIVHHREHTLLHFTTVPSVDDDLLFWSQVEDYGCFWVQAQFLVVFNLSLRSVVNHEIRFEIFQIFFRSTDKHVRYEVSLPCNFHDETHFQASSLVSAAETVDNKQFLIWKLLHSQILQYLPSLRSYRLVVILIFFRSPPYGVLRSSVFYDKLVLGRTTGINTCHHIHCTQFRYLTFFKTFQTSFGFFLEQYVVWRIVENLNSTGNTVLTQI